VVLDFSCALKLNNGKFIEGLLQFSSLPRTHILKLNSMTCKSFLPYTDTFKVKKGTTKIHQKMGQLEVA